MAEDRVICCMAVRGARFCMAEVRFCMAEANGGRGFPPSAHKECDFNDDCRIFILSYFNKLAHCIS